jgi:hypothetical protein
MEGLGLNETANPVLRFSESNLICGEIAVALAQSQNSAARYFKGT